MFARIYSLHLMPALTMAGVWSEGAMVLGKLPVPGRPTDLDSHLSVLSSFSLSLRDGPI